MPAPRGARVARAPPFQPDRGRRQAWTGRGGRVLVPRRSNACTCGHVPGALDLQWYPGAAVGCCGLPYDMCPGGVSE